MLLGTGDSDLSPVLLNTNFLHCREVAFYGALTHRQSLRHLFAGDCRRFFDKIEDFLLTLSEFRLRHVSVMVSDIRGVGRGKDDKGQGRVEQGSFTSPSHRTVRESLPSHGSSHSMLCAYASFIISSSLFKSCILQPTNLLLTEPR